MKILLVKPSYYGRDGRLVKLRKGKRIELTLPLLAALTPRNIEIEIIDETIQNVPFHTESDLIGITSLTRNAFRAYELADQFRQLGKKVVLGGIHATFLPDEALAHSDAVVLGEAEAVWQHLLNDFEKGNLQKIYSGKSLHNLKGIPPPRFDLLDLKNYRVHIFPVQDTRGCTLHCEFCSVAPFFRNKVLSRPIEDVLRDINSLKALGARRFFFVDENIAVGKKYMKDLLKALIPLKIEWMGQSSIQIVDDSEFMDLAVASGCFLLEIGFESLNPKNLSNCGKRFGSIEKYVRAIQILRANKIIIGASMIFGFDHDDGSIFSDTLNFLNEHDVPIMDSYILTPAPGTPIARSLLAEGRIYCTDWSRYGGEDVVFRPALMSAETLEHEFWSMKKRFYSMGNIVRRLFHVPLERIPVVAYVNLSNLLQLNLVFDSV